ncbi:MAG: zf-HC2 domain-containing protein [Candidatus Aminicenantes bacterium]|nr:zf-HC2 domain-containing protein [Candidatus Aminicenantes bacterium]
MNCQRIIRLLSAYQDGELDAARAREVESHVCGCAACRAEWDGLRELDRRLRRLPPPGADPFFATRVMAGLRPFPAGKWRLLQAVVHALVFVLIFAGGFVVQTALNGRSAARPATDSTFSAVLLEPFDLGLLAVHDDTMRLFAPERP